MKREAILIRESKDTNKAFYIDQQNAAVIMDFLKKDPANIKKFHYVLDLLLEHDHPPRDLYDKEDFEKGCEHVTAIKLFKGKKNPRIYCQQFAVEDRKVYVIVASELLEKKKSKKLTHKEKSLIRRVASYEYKLRDEG